SVSCKFLSFNCFRRTEMRLRISNALLCALLFSLPSAAQEQRGTIEGVVRDTSGAVLPGATVEARSAAGAVLSTVSDTTGSYRFPSVLPGTYQIAVTLPSFKDAKVSDVQVALAEIRRVDFALQLASVTETVNVIAVSPI